MQVFRGMPVMNMDLRPDLEDHESQDAPHEDEDGPINRKTMKVEYWRRAFRKWAAIEVSENGRGEVGN